MRKAYFLHFLEHPCNSLLNFFLELLNQRQNESFTKSCLTAPHSGPCTSTVRHYIIIKQHHNGHLKRERVGGQRLFWKWGYYQIFPEDHPKAWKADPLLSLWGSKPAHLWSGTVGGRHVRWHLIMCLSALLLASWVCVCVCATVA